MNIFAFCEHINNLIILFGPEKYMTSVRSRRVKLYGDYVHSGAVFSTGGAGVDMAKKIAAHRTMGESA